MSTNIIDSFLIALGFETDTKGAEDYKRSLEGVEKTLATVAGVATMAAAAIGWVVSKAAESMGQLQDFAEINNVSAAALDALGKAAAANNSSLDAVKASIQGLNGIMGEAVLGIGRGAKVFDKLGLSAKDASGNVKSTDAMLEEVAGKIQNLSRPEQLAYLSKLRIDPSLIMMLKDGPEAFREMRDEFGANGLFKEEDYKLAEQVDKLFKKATASVGLFAKQVSVTLFPVVKQMLEGYLAWFKEQRKANAETFAKGMKVLVAVLQTLWEYVGRAVAGIKSAIDWLKQFKVVTWAAAAALGVLVGIQVYNFAQSIIASALGMARAMFAFNAVALIWPAIIGAIILALVLLADELVNFMEGNDSFIGDLLQKYPNLGKTVTVVLGALGAAFVALKWQAIAAWAATVAGAVRSAIVTVMAAATIAGGIMPLIGIYASMAASAIAAGLSAAAAWLIAIAPIALVMLAIAAVAAAIWYVWANWESVRDKLVGMWESVRLAFAAAFNWISNKFDAIIGSIGSAISSVKTFLGLSDKANEIGKKPVEDAGGGYDAMGNPTGVSAFAGTGGLGVAAQPSSGGATTISSTEVNIPGGITVVSPDPAKAGENVKDELTKANRSATRNGQSAVAL